MRVLSSFFAIESITQAKKLYLYSFCFLSYRCYPRDLALSVCGSNPTPEQFQEGLVTYSEFIEHPHILSNPKLVVRFGGKYYPWKAATPLVVSLLFFNKSLPQVSGIQFI